MSETPQDSRLPQQRPAAKRADPPTLTLVSLIRTWRAQASQYDRDGVTTAACLLSRVADELEQVAGGETVTLAEAARRSGYCADHLRRIAGSGRLPNVGRKHAPRFRVVDLPTKGAYDFQKSEFPGMLDVQSRDG